MSKQQAPSVSHVPLQMPRLPRGNTHLWLGGVGRLSTEDTNLTAEELQQLKTANDARRASVVISAGTTSGTIFAMLSRLRYFGSPQRKAYRLAMAQAAQSLSEMENREEFVDGVIAGLGNMAGRFAVTELALLGYDHGGILVVGEVEGVAGMLLVVWVLFNKAGNSKLTGYCYVGVSLMFTCFSMSMFFLMEDEGVANWHEKYFVYSLYLNGAIVTATFAFQKVFRNIQVHPDVKFGCRTKHTPVDADGNPVDAQEGCCVRKNRCEINCCTAYLAKASANVCFFIRWMTILAYPITSVVLLGKEPFTPTHASTYPHWRLDLNSMDLQWNSPTWHVFPMVWGIASTWELNPNEVMQQVMNLSQRSNMSLNVSDVSENLFFTEEPFVREIDIPEQHFYSFFFIALVVAVLAVMSSGILLYGFLVASKKIMDAACGVSGLSVEHEDPDCDNPAPQATVLTPPEQKEKRSQELCKELLVLHDMDYRKAMQAISSYEPDEASET